MEAISHGKHISQAWSENTPSVTYMFHVSCLKPAQDPWQLIHGGEGCAFNPHRLKHKKGKVEEEEEINTGS